MKIKNKLQLLRCTLLCVILSACSSSTHELIDGAWLLDFDKSQWPNPLVTDSLSQTPDATGNTLHQLGSKLGEYRLHFKDGKRFFFQRNLIETTGFYSLLPQQELLVFTYDNQQDTFRIRKLGRQVLVLEQDSLVFHFRKVTP